LQQQQQQQQLLLVGHVAVAKTMQAFPVATAAAAAACVGTGCSSLTGKHVASGLHQQLCRGKEQ
jgi:hypothetical protein